MTILATWVAEAAQFIDPVPEPERGGTWLYCRWQQPERGGVTSCLFRTRRWKTYRQHWRRQHR